MKIDKLTREKHFVYITGAFYFHFDIGLELNFCTKIYTAKRGEFIAQSYLWDINFNLYFVFIFCKWWKWSKVYYGVNYSTYLFCGFRKRKCKQNDWLKVFLFAFFSWLLKSRCFRDSTKSPSSLKNDLSPNNKNELFITS